jgi:hypothetical protein
MVKEKLFAGDIEGAALEARAMPLGVDRAVAELAVQVTSAVLRCVQKDGDRAATALDVESLPAMPGLTDVRAWLLRLLREDGAPNAPAIPLTIHPYGEPADPEDWMGECGFVETEMATLLHAADKVRSDVSRALLQFQHGTLLEFHRLLHEASVERMAGGEEQVFDALNAYVQSLHASGAPATLVVLLWKRMNLSRIQLRCNAVAMPKELRKAGKVAADVPDAPDPDAEADEAGRQECGDSGENEDNLDDDPLTEATTKADEVDVPAEPGNEAYPEAAELRRMVQGESAGETLTLSELWRVMFRRVQTAIADDPTGQRQLLQTMFVGLLNLNAVMPKHLRPIPRKFKWNSARAALAIPHETAQDGVARDLDALSQSESQEGRVWRLVSARPDEDIDADQIADCAYAGTDTGTDKHAAVRRCIQVLNASLRAIRYERGIIRQPSQRAYRLIAHSSIPLHRYEGISSPERLRALEYLLLHDREPLSWEAAYQGLHGSHGGEDRGGYRSFRELIQGVASSGFLVVNTGAGTGTLFDAKTQGFLFNASTSLPHYLNISYSQYAILVELLRAKGEEVSREQLIAALGKAWHAANRPLPNDWAHTINKAFSNLENRLAGFAQLQCRRKPTVKTAQRGELLACSIKTEQPLAKEEPEAIAGVLT